MADIKGIELASEIYGLEDETARETATTASQTATQASQTATQASQTATQASQTATQASQTATQADSKIGNLADLQTTDKTSIVNAINENKADITELKATVKTLNISNKSFTMPQGAYVDWFSLTGLAQQPKMAMFTMTNILVDGNPFDCFACFESSKYGQHLRFSSVDSGVLLNAGTVITISGRVSYIQ